MKRVNVPKEVRDKVEAKLRKCIKLAEDHYGQKFTFPTIEYKLRGRTGGTANSRDWKVNFNSVLLMENGDKFINRTVPHELAHLVDYQLHPENFFSGRGRKQTIHGWTWKSIMRLFGAPTTRCHTYDTTNSKVRTRRITKHIWVCGCGEVEIKLGPKRHKNQLNSPSGYGYYKRGHPISKCGEYTYRGVEGAAPKPLLRAADAKAKAKPKRPAPRHNSPNKSSKLDMCRVLYFSIRHSAAAECSRKDIIRVFVDEAGCTPAGAATYYAKLKKELG